MRDYLYVSKPRVHSLFERVPAGLLPRLAAGAGIDPTRLGAPGPETGEVEDLHDRLGIVEKFLDREYDISEAAVNRPGSWFRGDMALRTAVYGRGGRGALLMTGQELHTVIVLVGSTDHLVGQRTTPETMMVSHRVLPSLFRLLEEIPEDWPSREPTRTSGVGHPPDEDRALEQALDYASTLRGPAVHCEFVARRLLHGTVHHQGVIPMIVVGAPLYVAMTEPAEEAR